LRKKTVIVTGAAGALGAALAKAACVRGWNVVMADRDQRGLDRAFDAIGDSATGEPTLYPVDLAGVTPDQVDEMLEQVRAAYGAIDAIVHCAVRFEGLTPLEHMDPVDWLMHMQVNLNAAWVLSARALPALREAEAGRVVFLLEDLEKVSGPLWGAYGVSKHALAALVRQLAVETRSSGVEVRGVNPGPMRSAIRARVYHEENPQDPPDPARAAERILDYLEARVAWPDPIVDFNSLD
jgi:NAD(P)-dependent dehydrogenase (short-subunit alcohol dehydrogenase family)